MIRLSIRWKILFVYVLLAVPLIIITAVVHQRWYDVRTEIAIRERLNIARLTGANFGGFVEELQRTLHADGHAIVDNESTASAAAPILRRLYDDYPLAHVAVLDPTGEVLMATDTRLLGDSLGGRDSFRRLLNRDAVFALEPVEVVQGVVGFRVARAIERGGRLAAVMVAFVDVDRLRHSLTVALPAGGQTIMDSEGKVVYDSEFPVIARAQPSWRGLAVVEQALRGQEASSEDFIFPPTGERRVAAVAPIPRLGWLAGSTVPAREVLDPIQASMLQSAAITILVLLAVLGLSAFFAQSIGGSLRRLAVSARRVGQGDFDHSVIMNTGDEVEEVARSLDETRLKLKGYMEALAAIAEAGRALTSSLQLSEVEKVIVRYLEQLFGAVGSWVLVHNEKTGSLEFLFVHGPGLEEFAGQTIAPGEGVAGKVFQSGQPAVVRDLREHPEAFGREILLEKGFSSTVQLPLTIGDRPFGVLGMSSPLIGTESFGGREVELLGTFASQVSIALQNARLFAERSRTAQLGLALNRINAALIATLELKGVLPQVVQEALEVVGSEAAALVLCREGEWQMEYAHGVPEQLRARGLTLDDFPISALALQARSAVVSNDAENDPRVNREVVRRLGLRSFLGVPLLVHGDVMGVLSFGYGSAPVAFTEAEVDFARKLATSMSLAMENARLYAAEQDIADTLQEALLTVPAEIAGIEFGQLYRSATEMARVGGDFYDLFEVEHGRVGIVIGDVSGKGLEAAALTSLVKNTIKAYAYEGNTPAEILAKTNEVVRASSPPASFVTVFLGILDKESGQLSYCSAGHPPALLRRTDGAVLQLTAPSPVIGVFPGQTYAESCHLMGEGDVLLLYTDGVIEARRNGELFGEERLRTIVAGLDQSTPGEIPQLIYSEVMNYTGGILSDDLALLAVTRRRAAGPAREGPANVSPPSPGGRFSLQ